MTASIFFAHDNFPAQFRFVAEAAMMQGYRCAAIASSTGQALPGTQSAMARTGCCWISSITTDCQRR